VWPTSHQPVQEIGRSASNVTGAGAQGLRHREGTMTATTTIRRDSAHPPLSSRTHARADDFFDESQLAELRTYTRPVKRVRLVTKVVVTVVDLVLIFALDAGPAVAGWFGSLAWPLKVVAVAAVFSLVSDVLQAPVSWWATMVHDKRHGLSNQSPGLWVADQLKGIVLGVVLGAALLVPVFWAIRTFDTWWLVGGLLFLAVAVFFSFVYPVLIMPRFNKFTPMPEGPLRSRIEEIAALAEVTIEGVYTMDGSKRSRRGNAFVAGFGPTKRVVVFDTMLDFPIEQIAQVVAHEIGHYRLNHIPKSFPLSGLQMLAVLAFVQYVGGHETVLGWAGVDDLGDPGAVPLFGTALTIPFTVFSIVSAWVSRRNEREADLEALELLGDPTSFVAMWPGMVELNKADLEPGWWDDLTSSHPQVPERMQFGLDWAEMNGVDVRRPEKAAVPEKAAATQDREGA
jgi:STE24 endopeptidase